MQSNRNIPFPWFTSFLFTASSEHGQDLSFESRSHFGKNGECVITFHERLIDLIGKFIQFNADPHIKMTPFPANATSNEEENTEGTKEQQEGESDNAMTQSTGEPTGAKRRKPNKTNKVTQSQVN